MNGEKICPLCERVMPEGSYNQHHLIPRTYKGKDVVDLHVICHDKIHHTFSEPELNQYYHTMERLKSHPVMERFIKWVKKQDPFFYDKHRDTKDRRRKRK